MKLQDNSAVVTGGGNGIGRALCLALASKGVNVAIADLEEGSAQTVADEVAALGVKSIAVRTDVTSEASLTQLADTAWQAFGSVELLINNAGVMQPTKPLFDTTQQDLDWVFSVNVGGVMNGIRTFVPRFIELGEPAYILNTASEHSLGVPHIGGGLYTASKHAVLGLSDVLREELPEHIGISVLCPGIVDSTLWRASERRQSEFGGATEAPEFAGTFMQQTGMPANEVADKAVQGIEQDEFMIVTHPHVIEIAKERWQTIESAFSNQAPRFDGDEKYNLKAIMASLQS